MRVLLFTTLIGERVDIPGGPKGLPTGGIERYCGQVRDAIEAEGHDVDVVISFGWRTVVARARGMLRLVDGVRRADVVWVFHPRLAFLVAPMARFWHVPLVVATHGFETWGAYPRRFRWGLEAADVVTVISKFTRAMTGSPARNAVLVPPSWGIETSDQDRPLSHADRNTVLLVARLSEAYKGADLATELAARFTDEPWQFVLAGAGQPSKAVLEAGDGFPNLRVVSNPDDATMADLFRRAAVVLLPSRTRVDDDNLWSGGEGFGIVLLEAARAGAAVLASDEGACPETVGLLGNGMVASPDADGFAPALAALMRDPAGREALGRMGRVRSASFSPESLRERVAGVLDRAIARR